MEALRIYLQERQMSQAELAAELGVSQPTVCDWLSGRSKPKTSRLLQISQVTGIAVEDLLKSAAA